MQTIILIKHSLHYKILYFNYTFLNSIFHSSDAYNNRWALTLEWTDEQHTSSYVGSSVRSSVNAHLLL